MGAERFDEGVEAEEQKTGGCGAWGGHRSKSPMRGWGWARFFVSFDPVLVFFVGWRKASETRCVIQTPEFCVRGGDGRLGRKCAQNGRSGLVSVYRKSITRRVGGRRSIN
jgi:hypothetical protein